MNSDIHQLKKISKSISVETKSKQATVIVNLVKELIQSTVAVHDEQESIEYDVYILPNDNDTNNVTINISFTGTPRLVGKADAKVCLLLNVLDDYVKASL